METRASYILVGAFVLGLLAAAVAIVIWLARGPVGRAPDRYAIYFTGDVTGLDVGGTVRYRGVPVGKVADIRIDPHNVERTRVLIDVKAGAPIKRDTVARISMLGITGVAFIQLSGGTRQAPPLKPAGSDRIAEIPSIPSPIQQAITRLPVLLERAVALGDRLSKLLNDQNLAAISATLDNLRQLTSSANADGNDLRAFLRQGQVAMTSLTDLARETNAAVKQFAQNIGPLAENADSTLAELRRTTKAFGTLATELDKVVAENRAPIRDFSQRGLQQVTQLAAEARVLVDSLTRLTQQIERDPARFFFGNSRQGYHAP